MVSARRGCYEAVLGGLTAAQISDLGFDSDRCGGKKWQNAVFLLRAQQTYESSILTRKHTWHLHFGIIVAFLYLRLMLS